MALTNDENLKYDSDPSKSPKSQRENVLHTIMSSASNRRIARSINQGDSSSSLGRKLSLGSEKQIISIADNRSHYESLFELHSDDSDDSEFEDLDEVDRMLPGLLERGIAYTIKETIFHGYIDKKGSGFDWIGSRAWKTRWAVLVKARTDGHNVDVPLLQIFWDYNSPSPSTIISLDSAVVLPENKVDNPKSDRDNIHPYRFKIRHVKKSVNPDISLQMTRVLSCSGESERDEWVYAINQALLEYEKEKACVRRLNSLSLSPPRVPYRVWAKEDVMPRSTRNSPRQKNTSSPPLVPSKQQNVITR
mmetsp:Transcript_12638/g.26790  ORF Transcript_12638/g.26790 Transcript_12638/m.26790 type:complete len:305 (+) Transcript_12638:293-1207(+)